MLILSNWVANTALYPPAHIYAGKQQGKQEKQAIAICEELYRLNWGDSTNIIGELQEAARAVNVVCAINYDHKMKHEYINKVFDDFLAKALTVNNALTEIFKKHQDLNKWRKDNLDATNAQIKEAIYTYRQAQLR
ncbi:hypothetical protein NCTGTJJY_CDS0087 [Serratia phage 92A1]|nr:hypothetical protein NCTGTJJY_CDS0087 [Serratia phage 92A1]